MEDHTITVDYRINIAKGYAGLHCGVLHNKETDMDEWVMIIGKLKEKHSVGDPVQYDDYEKRLLAIVFEDSEQAAQYAKMFTELANMMKKLEESNEE